MRRAAAIAGAAYLGTLLVVPFIDRETDFLRAYPEDYATGVAGPLVRLGYVAIAFMALAIGASLGREGTWLERIAAVLLAAGSATSLVLAIAPQQLTGGPLLVGVFGLVFAPLLTSIGAGKRLSTIVVRLGVMATAGFVALMIAPHELAGITNRSWDVLLAVWGLSFALIPRKASAREPPRLRAPGDAQP